MRRTSIFVLLATLLFSACTSSMPTPGPTAMPLRIPTLAPTATSPIIPTVTPTPTEEVAAVSSTGAGIPTATPNLADFRVDRRSFTSPDGEWTAQVTVALPVISDTAVSSYYTQLKVSKNSG